MDSGIQVYSWEWIRFNAPTRHNRSFWGRNLQATYPNQDSQSTEGQNGLLRYKRSSTAGGKDGIGAGYGETWSVADVQLEATLTLQSSQFTKNSRHRLDVPPVRLYSRQAGVSGFWCHRLERPASSDNDSRPSCLPVPTKTTLSCDSCVTITIHHYCLDTCGHCNN